MKNTVMKNTVTIVILDDHALIRHAVRNLIGSHEHLMLVGEGATGAELFSLVAEHRPDIVVLDLNMPHFELGTNGQSGPRFQALPHLVRLRREYPQTVVIILSEHIMPSLIQESVLCGVKGYILKSDDLSLSLPETIERVSRGEIFFSKAVERELFGEGIGVDVPSLTPRQIEVVVTVAAMPGASRPQKAAALGISALTFRNHLTRIFELLGVNNVTSCLLRCLQLGIISLDDLLVEEESIESL